MKKEFKVTPYEVKGEIDYEKLIKEFGIKPMPKLPSIFQGNVLFRRKVIFAHRDFERILDCINKKKKVVMMTGLMPTGKFHLGHMLLAQQFIFFSHSQLSEQGQTQSPYCPRQNPILKDNHLKI